VANATRNRNKIFIQNVWSRTIGGPLLLGARWTLPITNCLAYRYARERQSSLLQVIQCTRHLCPLDCRTVQWTVRWKSHPCVLVRIRWTHRWTKDVLEDRQRTHQRTAQRKTLSCKRHNRSREHHSWINKRKVYI
jgi:hypothetical protein